MRERDRDPERERRIEDEVIVDTYSREEQAMGWYAYLDDRMDTPFQARCIAERAVSPLEVGEAVRVLGVARTEPTITRILVTVEWRDSTLGVPLEQLEPISTDDDTARAIEDWQYWLDH